MKKIIIFSMGLMILVAGCGESLFTGAENKNTNVGIQDEGDFAFIDGKCQKYIDMYKEKADAQLLTTDELYKYNSSVLSCAGFSSMKSLTTIFDQGGVIDPFGLIQGMMGTDIFTPEESAKLKEAYKTVLGTCQEMSSLATSMQTICGMTAAADTVRMLGDVAMEITGGNIAIDQTGMENAIGSVDEAGITQAVEKTLNTIDIDAIAKNLEIMTGAATVIAEQTNMTDLSDNLNDFVNSVKGQDGTVSTGSIAGYLNGQFRK